MVKKLFLLRHGDASSETSNIADHDRPLSNTGKIQITNIANRLIERKWLPSLIIGSSATRAFSSAEIIKNIIQISRKTALNINKNEILYSASVFKYIEILQTQKDSSESIMLVAHNPTISNFISRLTGKHIGMGTANLCLLVLDIEKWSKLSFNTTIINSTFLKP